MTHFLMTPLSDALKNCLGDARFATEKPPRCDCDAHDHPHMQGVSQRCSRKQFAARQWAWRLNNSEKEQAA